MAKKISKKFLVETLKQLIEQEQESSKGFPAKPPKNMPVTETGGPKSEEVVALFKQLGASSPKSGEEQLKQIGGEKALARNYELLQKQFAGSGNNPAQRLGGLARQYPQFAGPLIGLPALNPLNGYFAGGGAGGGGGPGGDPSITHGADRAGGGGSTGSGGTPLAGQPAVDGTGSGGGGGSGRWDPNHNGVMGPGGDGGNGIVIVRYPVS